MSIEKSLKRIIDILEERLPDKSNRVMDDVELYLEIDGHDYGLMEDGIYAWTKSGDYLEYAQSINDLSMSLDLDFGDWNDPYGQNYYYVVLPDPFGDKYYTRLLSRNNRDEPVIDGQWFKTDNDMWEHISDNPDYMFTKEEILTSHPYLWECRMWGGSR